MDPFLGMSIVRDSRLGRAETGGRAWCFVVLHATGGPVVLNRGFKYIVARPKIQENIVPSAVGLVVIIAAFPYSAIVKL